MILTPSTKDARRRMAKVLVNGGAQGRLKDFGENRADICADILTAYTADSRVSALDEREVFEICLAAYHLGLSISPEGGNARLQSLNGQAGIFIGMSGLFYLLAHRT